MSTLFLLRLLAGLAIGSVFFAFLALLWGGFLTYLNCSRKKKKKGRSKIRKRMEALREAHPKQPLSKQEILLLRKSKQIKHRQQFLNRLAKRNR